MYIQKQRHDYVYKIANFEKYVTKIDLKKIR